MKTGKEVSLWQPSRNVPAEAVQILPAATVMLVSSNAVEDYDAYSGMMLWRVYPQHRFRTAVRQNADMNASGGHHDRRTDLSLYIPDGDSHIAKIDTLAGRTVWRAKIEGRIGRPVQIVPADKVVWIAADRGCDIVDEETGKVLSAVTMPKEIAAHAAVRESALCEAGLLCLVTHRGQTSTPAMPATIVLFRHKKGEGSAAIVAVIEKASGGIGGWQIGEGSVVLADGNRLIGLKGR